MAEFGEFKFTNAGLALEAKVHTGKTLTFTKFVLGDGNYDGNIRNLTALVNPVMNQEVARLSIQNTTDTETGNLLKVVSCGFTINTLTLENGFYLREIGLYARDPDTNEEVLYKYGNAGDTADYIAPGSSTTISEKAQNILMYFSDDADIHADVDPSTTYVTTSTFESAIQDIESEIASLDISWGNITGTLANQTDLNTALGSKENISNKVTSIDEFSTDTQYPSAAAVYGTLPLRKEVTLTAANWTLNSETGLYEYTVTDSDVTANHKVEGTFDLANQAKIKDGYTETFSGSYKIYTSELPTENITMYADIYLLRGASV